MTRPFAVVLVVALSVMWLVSAAVAADDCCPTTEQDSSIIMVAQADAPAAGSLPEGHPPISSPSAGQGMPEGHPPISSPNSAQGLPEGHPPMTAPTNEPFDATLIVKVEQGTADGASLVGTDVVVSFYQRGQVLVERTEKLDATGMVMLEKVAMIGVVQPVVTITHDGVAFEAIGKPMGSMAADQLVRLTLYDAAKDKPDWSIQMRHVMVRRIEGGIQVSEMIAVSNPTDRVWPGIAPPADDAEHAGHAHAEPVTFTLPLPAGVQHVSVGQGFRRNSGARLEGGLLYSTTPMLPGTTQYQIDYLVPAADGKISLDVAAPVAVQHLMVFVPDNGEAVTPRGLTAGQTIQSGPGSVRSFSAEQVPADQTVGLTIDAAGDAPVAAPDAMSSSQTPPAAPVATTPLEGRKLLIGIVAGVMVCAAFAVVALRGKGNRSTTTGVLV